jgi:hypothetical protein
MTFNRQCASLIECQVYVRGVRHGRVNALISARALPNNGRSYRALCKWPRLTAKGYDDRGEFCWATVTRNGDTIFLKPLRIRPGAPPSKPPFKITNDSCGCDGTLYLLMLLVVVWMVFVAVALNAYIAHGV